MSSFIYLLYQKYIKWKYILFLRTLECWWSFSIVVAVKGTQDNWQICGYLLKDTPVINCKVSGFFKGNQFITAGAQHVVANNSQLSKWWRGTARNLVLVKQEQYCFLSPEINDKRSQISKTITLWVVTEEGSFVGESCLWCDKCFIKQGIILG